MNSREYFRETQPDFLLHSVPKGPKSGRASLKTRKGRASLKTRKGRASLKTRKGRASSKTRKGLVQGKFTGHEKRRKLTICGSLTILFLDSTDILKVVILIFYYINFT
jgi:hypothetical protein